MLILKFLLNLETNGGIEVEKIKIKLMRKVIDL